MASMRVLLTAMIALFSPALMGAAQPDPGPEPEDELPGFENAAMVSGLSVMVERPDKRLVADQDTTYTIAVSNRGEDPAELTIRVTVPPWMSEADPRDGGELGEGFVDWPVSVAPGEVTIMRMTGAYGSPEPDTPTRVAFTACALEREEPQPIVCATDIAQLESAGSDTGWYWPAASATAAAAALGTGLFLWGRRRRAKVAAASAEANDPGSAGPPQQEPAEPEDDPVRATAEISHEAPGAAAAGTDPSATESADAAEEPESPAIEPEAPSAGIEAAATDDEAGVLEGEVVEGELEIAEAEPGEAAESATRG